jgi:malonyl-CoA O-methyltransferase
MFFPEHVLKKKITQIAHSYDAFAALYRKIADRLLMHVECMRLAPSVILDVGAGTGYISALLKKCYPCADIIALDFVEAILSQNTDKNILSLCADAAHLPFADASVDLIVSGVMLPWCENAEAIFAQVQRVLKPGGLFLFSTFGPDTLGEVRASWAAVDEMPHVHLFFDLHDIGDALLRAGFADPVMQTEWLTLLYKSTESLFQDIKKTGSSNILLERRMTLTGKKRFQRFLAEYNTYCDEKGEFPATFEVLYGHCWKDIRSLQKAGEVKIPIAEIRNRKNKP